MSKTFETNALKGKSLAAGMKRRIAELGKYGVKEADLTVMEQDADKAIEMIREVDRLREEVTRKLQAANEQLCSLRDRAAVYRKIIKQNYLQDQWAGFGLQDKRCDKTAPQSYSAKDIAHTFRDNEPYSKDHRQHNEKDKKKLKEFQSVHTNSNSHVQ